MREASRVCGIACYLAVARASPIGIPMGVGVDADGRNEHGREDYYIRCMSDPLALLCRGPDRPGVLHAVTGVVARHGGNITSVAIAERDVSATVHLEIELPEDTAESRERLVAELRELESIDEVQTVPTMLEVFGKRLIVIGGGAQVGQVAVGAVSEADRHNIRGEKISIDTIPVVGEKNIADAVRAVGRLPRAVGVVLAGSLMGGEITDAVHEVRSRGIFVISLNMPGSAAEAADLIVTDPVQAGVMAVMAIAKTARFDISRQRGRRY